MDECIGFKVISAAVSSKNFGRIKRASRAGKRLYFGLLRKTASGCTPAMLVDAAMSLTDAISSYCKMRKTMEITHQLEIGNIALKHGIENIKKMIDLKEEGELESFEMDAMESIICLESAKDNLLKFGECLRMVSESLNLLRDRNLVASKSAEVLEQSFLDTSLLYLEALESVI